MEVSNPLDTKVLKEGSLGDFLRDKADRWTGPSDEYNEVDEHRTQDSDLPELGKNLLQFWGFDKDCTFITEERLNLAELGADISINNGTIRPLI